MTSEADRSDRPERKRYSMLTSLEFESNIVPWGSPFALTLHRDADQLVLQWPAASAGGFRVETTTDFKIWTTAETLPVNMSGTNFWTDSLREAPHFYRVWRTP